MRVWDNGTTISDEDLMEYLPDQIFPEVEDVTLRIDDKALYIYGTNSTWALQSDISLAEGSGCMSFFYTDDLLFEIETAQEKQTYSLTKARELGIPSPEEIQLIKRGTPWVFSFACVNRTRLKIYATIINVSWAPGENIDEYNE